MTDSKRKKNLNLRVNSLLSQKADTDELILRLRHLQLEREKIQAKIASVDYECDVLKEILLCSSEEYVKFIIDEAFPQSQSHSQLSNKEVNLLNNRVSLLNFDTLQKLFGISVRGLEEGKIIVQFMPPDNYEPPNVALLSLNQKEKIFKLNHFILPEIVPVRELEKNYLGNEEGQDIGVFINSIYSYMLAFWRRDIEVKNMKASKDMENSIIYHNKGRTVISFTLHFMSKYEIEISLRYDPLNHIPSSTRILEKDAQELPEDLVAALTDLQQSLLAHPVSEVLRVNLSSSQEGSQKSGSSSNSTVLFDLFK